MEYNNYVKKVIKYDKNLERLSKKYSTAFPELFYDENPSESACLEAVKENGHLLAFIEHQMVELCLAAVK